MFFKSSSCRIGLFILDVPAAVPQDEGGPGPGGHGPSDDDEDGADNDKHLGAGEAAVEESPGDDDADELDGIPIDNEDDMDGSLGTGLTEPDDSPEDGIRRSLHDVACFHTV